MSLTPNEKKVLYCMGIMGFVGILTFSSGYVYSSESKKMRQNMKILEQQRKIMEQEEIIGTLSSRFGKDVPINTQIRIDQKSQACLDLNAINEAGDYAGSDKEIADIGLIGSVVLNRAKKYGQSVCDVIYDRCGRGQCFSWVKDGRSAQTLEGAKRLKPEKYKTAHEINHGLLTGTRKTISEVLYYNNPRSSENGWHLSMVQKGQFLPAFTIGNEASPSYHIYYVENQKNSQIIKNNVSQILMGMK